MATIGVQHHLMFIDGKGVDGEEFYEIRSPATDELVCTMAKGTIEHADLAVEAARRSFEAGVWSRLPGLPSWATRCGAWTSTRRRSHA